jgi:hypothetical protein
VSDIIGQNAKSHFQDLHSREREVIHHGSVRTLPASTTKWNYPMEMPQMTPNAPMGLSFDIADLMLLQGWAEFHEVQMVVELDHWVEGEEYEEVVAFYGKDSPLRRWILWRAASEIVVQPLIGRGHRFCSVADALESLIPARS